MTSATTHALITGATSGIGYELARRFAEDGKNLILVARLEERLAAVQAELRDTFKVDVQVLDIDLFEPGAAAEVYRQVQAAGLVVDVLVNNAGQGLWGHFAELDLDRQLLLIRLNIDALVSLTHYFLKDMLARDDGKILQLGSIFSKVPAPLMAVYAASKAFVLSFGEALINELKDSKVTMTVLMPGATDTDFFHKAGAEISKTFGQAPLADPAKVARDGYDALMSGRSSIVSGFLTKVTSVISDLVPYTVNAAMARSVNERFEEPEGEMRNESTHEASREEHEALRRRGER